MCRRRPRSGRPVGVVGAGPDPKSKPKPLVLGGPRRPRRPEPASTGKSWSSRAARCRRPPGGLASPDGPRPQRPAPAVGGESPAPGRGPSPLPPAPAAPRRPFRARPPRATDTAEDRTGGASVARPRLTAPEWSGVDVGAGVLAGRGGGGGEFRRGALAGRADGAGGVARGGPWGPVVQAPRPLPPAPRAPSDPVPARPRPSPPPRPRLGGRGPGRSAGPGGCRSCQA